MTLVCRAVPHGSAEYLQAVELRRQVLRLPLGLDFTEQELSLEFKDEHWIVTRDDPVVACLVAVFLPNQEVKIRQVAVAPDHQGQSIGKGLMQTVEANLQQRGFRAIILHARQNVVPWYQAQGYEIIGDPFVEVTLPHRAMRKPL